MGFYNDYIAPGVRYATYLAFLTTIIIFGLQIRKIYQSNCRIMIFDALGKPFIPAMIFLILFFWKEINEFVMRSVLVGGEIESPSTSPETSSAPMRESPSTSP